ncbi:MAG: O-antigen ligase family protein [Desulfovibrio sp.]|nr:O-antigen ligase family protein [Desulfovibrio sp.]MCA1985408.1 O-antigen ligase family protein [Desulfovibrio sp.]
MSLLRMLGIVTAGGAAVLLAGVFFSLPWWVFASVTGGVGAGALFLAKPRAAWWCMLALFFVATPSIFFRPDGFQASIFLAHVLLPITLLGTFLHAVARRDSLGAGTSLMPLLLLVLGMHGLAWFWAPKSEFGLFNVGAMTANVLLFWCIVYHVRTVDDLRRLCWALFVGGIICGAGVTASQWWEPDWKYTPSTYWGAGFTFFVGRFGGFVASNHAAAYLVAAGCAAAALRADACSRVARLGLLLGAGFFLYAIVLTQSRGALMALFAAAFAVFALHEGLRRRFIRHALAFVLFVLCCVVVAEPGYLDRLLIGFGYQGDLIFSEKPEDKQETQENLSGMSARFRMWRDGLHAMRQEPATFLGGLGPGGFVTITKEPEVHSFWLTFFFDLGLAGVVLQVFIWIWLISHFARIIKRPIPPALAPFFWAMLAACLAELGVHGLIDHDLTSMVSRFTFLFLALAAATIKVATREQQEGDDTCPQKYTAS